MVFLSSQLSLRELSQFHRERAISAAFPVFSSLHKHRGKNGRMEQKRSYSSSGREK
jgi:hypothetical protein